MLEFSLVFLAQVILIVLVPEEGGPTRAEKKVEGNVKRVDQFITFDHDECSEAANKNQSVNDPHPWPWSIEDASHLFVMIFEWNGLNLVRG